MSLNITPLSPEYKEARARQLATSMLVPVTAVVTCWMDDPKKNIYFVAKSEPALANALSYHAFETAEDAEAFVARNGPTTVVARLAVKSQKKRGPKKRKADDEDEEAPKKTMMKKKKNPVTRKAAASTNPKRRAAEGLR